MNIRELQVKDWVYIRKELCAAKVEALLHSTCSTDIGFYKYEDLEPISLTAETFEANGFVLKENVFGLAWCHEQWAFKCTKDKVVFVTDGHGHGRELRYIHEFQHYLRCCGLEEVANTFRVSKNIF